MRLHYFLILILGLLLGCKPDPKIPKWNVEALTPIVHSRVNITDMVPDSSLKVGENGFLSLVYQTNLARLQPDEIFEPLNQDFQNTIKLNNIDFGTRVLKDSISLGELSSNGSPQGQFIIYNNGQTAVVPPFAPVYRKSTTINATDLFQTVTLLSGKATLKIQNNFPVPLTDIKFLLENINSRTPVVKKRLDTLKAGQEYSEIFPLNNITIEGLLNVELEKFSSPGSGTQQVVIDTSDQIVMSIILSDLVPVSATAVFPRQNLANDTTSTSIAAGNAQLTSIKVKEGKIFLDANSTIEDNISLDYKIPNAKKNGNQLGFTENISAAPSSGFSTTFKEVDISGYEVDLTGKSADLGVYNSFYTILLGRIDSSGKLIHLSLQDSVFLETGIRNLTASEGYGYLGKDTIEGSETSKVDIFKSLEQGNFDLDDVILSIGVENHIGAPIDLQLNSLRSQRSTGTVALNWTTLGQSSTVPAATLASNNLPIPGRLNLTIDKTNSNLDKLIENQPELFMGDFAAYINGSTSSPEYNQFIFTEYGVDVNLNLEVPLNFSAKNILLADTNSFSYSDLDPKNQLQHGALKVIAESNFPLESNVELIMLNGQGVQIGKLTSPDKIEAAEVDGDGNAISVVKSVTEYPLTKQSIALLKKTTHLVFQVQLDTPLPPQKIRLYQSNYIDLTLSGDLTIRTR